MAFSKKTWTDRVSEYPARRNLTDTSGNSTTYTVSRNEGEIAQKGDAFNASNMNDLEDRIEDSINAVSTDIATALNSIDILDSLSNITANTTDNKIAGAKGVKEMYTTLQSNFQAGVDSLYNKCVSMGVTPTAKTPTAIISAIDDIYNAGITYGKENVSVYINATQYYYSDPAGSDKQYNKSANFTVTANTSNMKVGSGGDYLVINGIKIS